MKTMTPNEVKTESTEKWEIAAAKDIFSADEIIDAYFQGKKDGLEQHKKTLIAQLESNIRKAADHTQKVKNYLIELNLSPKSAHLKIKTLYFLEVLITFSEQDYLNESIIKAYDYVTAFEGAVSEELYKVSFSFTYENEGFNEALLYADGFSHKKQLAKA